MFSVSKLKIINPVFLKKTQIQAPQNCLLSLFLFSSSSLLHVPTLSVIMVTLRSHTREKARRSTWAFLPPEIRRMILEEISRQRRWSCASTVCKEWHAIVATENLNRLELNGASAEGLSKIILQRHLVRQIYLNIELPAYTCPQCRGFASSSEHGKLTRDALQKLSKALAAWEPTHHITLELNAYSPNDTDHCFKNHLYGFKHENDEDLLEKQEAWDDQRHGWVKGKQVRLPTTGAIQQLFSTVISGAQGEKTQKVPAVKGVVIRRQMRRKIDRLALPKLLKQFPNLQSINYEPWRVLFHQPDLLDSSCDRCDQSKSTADTTGISWYLTLLCNSVAEWASKMAQARQISDYFRGLQRTDHGSYSERHRPDH